MWVIVYGHARMSSEGHVEFWGLMRALEWPQYYQILASISWDTDQNVSGTGPGRIVTRLADENNTACIYITCLKMFCLSASY